MRGIHRSTMNPVYIFAPRDEFKKKLHLKMIRFLMYIISVIVTFIIF